MRTPLDDADDFINAQYKPYYLSWCTSYDQEVRELRELIASNPGDVEMIKYFSEGNLSKIRKGKVEE